MNTDWIPLEPGEPIGVVALSGPVDADKLDAGLQVIRGWGHPVIEASNLHHETAYLAGRDEDRLAGLEEVIESGARILVAARGGYGVSRLLGLVDWGELSKRGICMVGFSDLTAILNPLSRDGIVQIHGPMVASGLVSSHNARRLRSVLLGDLKGDALFRIPNSSIARPGCAEGRTLGGNLTVLTTLIGTPWEPDFNGSVLFLEEVNEPLYRLDRMLTHLRGSGKLRNVKALIGGSLRGCRPASGRPDLWRRLLCEAAPPTAPVIVDLPFGHGASNFAFPIGTTVEIDTNAQQIIWK